MGVLQGEVGLDPLDLDQELLPDNLDLVKPDEIVQLGRTDVDRVDDIEVISWYGRMTLMLVDPVQHE